MATNSILLLNGLPPRTQLTVDGHSEAYLINEQFAGIKALPPGWHCISWSIAPNQDSSQTGGVAAEGSVRNVFFRWFEDGEVSIRELDRVQERLATPNQHGSGSNIGRSNQTRISRTFDSSCKPVSTIVTPEVLGSVEPRLLPYPSTAHRSWQDVTRHLGIDNGGVGKKVVARVLGVDALSGDFTTDSLATGPSRAKDAREQASIQQVGGTGRNENGKIIWGKSRPEDEREQFELFEVTETNGSDSTADSEQKKRKRPSPTSSSNKDEVNDEDSLLFTSFDLRRSWPPNSIGAEVTRWSEDKSWLLQDVATRSRLGVTLDGADDDEWCLPLLCEFELAFVLFIMASNVYAWEQWKDLAALFCRSSTIIGAQSAFQLHPSMTSESASEAQDNGDEVRLDGHIAFLSTLRAQLILLQSDFWSTQTSPSEEQAVLKELDILRANIARSLSAAGLANQPGNGTAQEAQRAKLVTAWRSLSHLTFEKFGWQLDRRLDEEAEVEDDMKAEEGEDAPVIVDL